MAGQGLRRQRRERRRHRQRTWFSDQLPVEDVREGTLDTVIDGASAVGGQNMNKKDSN